MPAGLPAAGANMLATVIQTLLEVSVMVRVGEPGAAYDLLDDGIESLDDALSERAMGWDDYCFMDRDECRAY